MAEWKKWTFGRSTRDNIEELVLAQGVTLILTDIEHVPEWNATLCIRSRGFDYGKSFTLWPNEIAPDTYGDDLWEAMRRETRARALEHLAVLQALARAGMDTLLAP